VSLSDSADLAYRSRAIIITVAGNVKYTIDGEAITVGVPIGVIPFVADRLWQNGTTATIGGYYPW
jgi:hypothetical protein